METDVYDFYKKIETKKDFEEFLRLLKEDYSVNRESWENANLGLFLEGLYGYNYSTNEEESFEPPTWKMFAEMLLAAKVYE